MTLIPIGVPDSFITRIILDSDFTEKEHQHRKRVMCRGCDSIRTARHPCIHTAECTYEVLKSDGELLPEADTEECPGNFGVYLVYKVPPTGRDKWLEDFKKHADKVRGEIKDG